MENSPKSTVVKTEEIWLLIPEVLIIWGLARRSVDYAIWRDNIKARQSRAGATWLCTASSCQAFWGEPKNPELLKEIIADVHAQ